MGLQPKTAQVRDGKATGLDIASVVAGDIGASGSPFDGEVIEGDSYVDEAMITGEPVPVAKAPGALVTGGTVNQKGAFAFRATAWAATPCWPRSSMVEEAQGLNCRSRRWSTG